MTFAVEGLQTSVHTHVLVSPIQFEPGSKSSRWRANRLPLRRLFILLAFLGGGAGLVGVRQWREARREETGPKQNSEGGDGGEGGGGWSETCLTACCDQKVLEPAFESSIWAVARAGRSRSGLLM